MGELVRLIILSLWLIRLLALQLSLTLASFVHLMSPEGR